MAKTQSNNIIDLDNIKIEKLSSKYRSKAADFLLANWHAYYCKQLPQHLVDIKTYEACYQYLSVRQHTIFIARHHKKIVGIIAGVYNCIDEIWVDKDYQRQKIGTRLVNHLLNRFHEKNYLYAQVGCEDFNQSIIDFFKAMDWYFIDSEELEVDSNYKFNVKVFGKRLPIQP